ncbi:MAG: hypothetical protein RMJ56_05495 [Gemmataceae bacterium]|nr:hypothetical protein [Gemmata sp.]MDW8197043.1 hypothetical protein [Gemmataceae bacterium]
MRLGRGVVASSGWVIAIVSITAMAADPPLTATVVDAEKNSWDVKELKFGMGTRRLTWLADPQGETDDARKGPLALEVREPHSTTYSKGIVTYVPLASVASIHYDYDKKTAAIAVKGREAPLIGTLEYKGLNVLGFSGQVDGVAKTFSGGAFTKGNIHAVAFPQPVPVPARKSLAAWHIQIDQPKAMNPTLTVGDMKFLYQLSNGSEFLTEAAAVYKSEPLRCDATLTSYTTLAIDPASRIITAEVYGGDHERIVVILPTMSKDGQTATLVGLVAEVDVGWKLFPLHTIKTMKRPRRD